MKKNTPLQIYGFVSLVVMVCAWGYFWYFLAWHTLIAYIISINGVTLLMYAWDKAISPTTMVRVPEVLLHTLAFLGGSPAALLGQKLFRHKTQKTTFQIWFWVIVLSQVLGLGWWIYTQAF